MKQLMMTTAMLALATTAFAASDVMPATAYDGSAEAMTFEQMDANADGAITITEASADPATSQNFENADVNGDRKLDPQEYANLKSEGDTEEAE